MVHVCVCTHCFHVNLLTVAVLQPSFFCAAEQVLCHSQDWFVREVDAKAIVYDLEDIIDEGFETTITRVPNTTQQKFNQCSMNTWRKCVMKTPC